MAYKNSLCPQQTMKTAFGSLRQNLSSMGGYSKYKQWRSKGQRYIHEISQMQTATSLVLTPINIVSIIMTSLHQSLPRRIVGLAVIKVTTSSISISCSFSSSHRHHFHTVIHYLYLATAALWLLPGQQQSTSSSTSPNTQPLTRMVMWHAFHFY